MIKTIQTGSAVCHELELFRNNYKRLKLQLVTLKLLQPQRFLSPKLSTNGQLVVGSVMNLASCWS